MPEVLPEQNYNFGLMPMQATEPLAPGQEVLYLDGQTGVEVGLDCDGTADLGEYIGGLIAAVKGLPYEQVDKAGSDTKTALGKLAVLCGGQGVLGGKPTALLTEAEQLFREAGELLEEARKKTRNHLTEITGETPDL